MTAKKKIQRKAEKHYPIVRFTSDLFEGTFELPALSSFPLKVQRKLMAGDVDPLFQLLEDAHVSEDAQDAVDSLSGDEVGTFMEEWGNASEIPAGESGD